MTEELARRFWTMTNEPAEKRRLRRYEAILSDAYARIVEAANEDVAGIGLDQLREATTWPSQTNCSWLMYIAADMLRSALPSMEAEARP